MINNFLKEITIGYDGLIRKIEFLSFDSAFVVISVMKKTNGEWVNVKFHLKGLKEFSVKQKPNHSNVVLSGGISYMIINNIHFIDFSPYSDSMENENDFRMSDVYFASELIECEVLPYSE
ncbi:hypothetical protein AB4J97_03090 [Serratia fonticola]|uniref:hypothetical protein n=1 Tax=Serratia fonticola TaxID=47917 RepID=UPI00217C7E65|nr:hypothetical protein [Serratia fonticola]CAI0708774.1 Uncharacterised protein [Serratia fonticola]CAI0709725.1 Uncharacterised protein [Serratia fonticola]